MENNGSFLMVMQIAIISICLLTIPSIIYGGEYTHQEVEDAVNKKILPDYCVYMGVGRKKNTLKGKRYRQIYGKDWKHMHHYCWALLDAINGSHRYAIGNLDYVLKNSSRTFKLRPMVLKQKAQILILNGRALEAVPVYYEMIYVKPDSEYGYISLANIFLLHGDKERAKEICRLGLKNVPDSVNLKEILRKCRDHEK